MGSLARAYPVGAFPFVDGTPLAWRDEVMAWLREIATVVHGQVPIQLGLLGWETDDSGLSAEGLRMEGIPTERYEGLLVPENADLRWIPPTHGASITVGKGNA